MGKRKYHRLLILLLAAGMLGGCGTPMCELTDDEKELIVSYSAYAVSKHNIYQKDGYVNTYPQEETETEASHGNQESSTQQDIGNVAGEAGGTQADDGSVQITEEVSLAKAIGHASDLKISYKGYEINENYNEGNYFSLGADQGKTFLILKIRMKNKTDSTVKVNNLGKGLKFQCSLDGEDSIPAEETFAMKVFSNYEGSIKAGKSEDVVLLFQIDKGQAAKIGNFTLTVTEDGTTSRIKL